MDEIVKICKTHGELTRKKCKPNHKWFTCLECFNKWQREYRKSSIEKNKSRIRSSKFYWNNRERLIARRNELLEKDKKKLKDRSWREKNKEKIIKYHIKRNIIFKNQVDKLDDRYIISALRNGTHLKSKDIPQELIEIKRLHLQLIRKIREIKECQSRP
jgi:hypothetical protein